MPVGPGTIKLRSIVTSDAQTWDLAWKQNVTPWDVLGDIQPPLKEVLESGELQLPKHGRALVPGCGKGYDAIHIAHKLGYETLGVDVSTTAVEAAKKHLESTTQTNGQLPSGSVDFQALNFFTAGPGLDNATFDLVYDYTFFVAIPPSQRPAWGSRMRELLKPGGHLITLVYPLDEYTDQGPPFYVRPEHYVDALGDGWVKVVDRVPKVSSKTHVGRERIVVWKRV